MQTMNSGLMFPVGVSFLYKMYFYTSVSRLDCFTLDGGLYLYLHFLDGKLVKSCAGITNFVHFKDSRSVFKSSSFLANSAN